MEFSTGAHRRRGGGHCSVRGAAGAAVDSAIRSGAQSYDRMRDLPALIRLDPFARLPENVETAATIVLRLQRALRSERARARSGHWAYDLNRHIALRQAFRAETERLAALQAQEGSCPGMGDGARPVREP